MYRIFAMAMLCLLWAAPALADFAAGVAAFQSGDYETAHAEWLPLAEDGHAAAQHNVGLLYNRGLGVATDKAVAADWFRRAAVQGHSNGQAKLGFLYAQGQGVEQDYAVSARWFRAAAIQGHGVAQFNTGILYAAGLGVERDRVESLMWLSFAADKGLQGAIAKRDQLSAMMTPEEIEQSKRLAAAFDPKKEAAALAATSAPAALAAAPVDPPTPEAIPEPVAVPALEATVEPANYPPPPAAKPKIAAAKPTVPAPKTTPPPTDPAPAATAPLEAPRAIRLATYRTRESAEDGWSNLRASHPDLLAQLTRDVIEDADGYFRLEAGPVTDREHADALCADLRRRNLFCTPVM